MLSVIGAASRRALIEAIVPASIKRSAGMQLPPAITEAAALAELKALASQPGAPGGPPPAEGQGGLKAHPQSGGEE